MSGGVDAGLQIIDELRAGQTLTGYYLLDATRADLLRRAGKLPEAALAYEQAASLAPSEPERRFLMRRHRELGE
jgi:RNA polymerase sigma-70 factor (ECF subfamily)